MPAFPPPTAQYVTERIVAITVADGVARHESLGSGTDGKVFRRPLDLAAAVEPRRYRTGGQTPTRVGRRTTPSDFVNDAWKYDHVNVHTFYLVFPRAVRPGRLATPFGAVALKPGPAAAFRLSAVGYRPESDAKFVYLSAWAGDLGALDLSAGTTFRVLDAAGRVRLTGKTRLRKAATEADSKIPAEAGWNDARTDVREADVSAIRAPGTYRGQVPGIGASTTRRTGWSRTRSTTSVRSQTGAALRPSRTPTSL